MIKEVIVNLIAFIKTWAEGIIFSVIIASIMEMIIPNGSSKRYIKVVIGIYILFVIIAPIINNFSKNTIDVSSIFNYDLKQDAIAVSSEVLEEQNLINIKSMYELNLKSDIKVKLKNKGFIVDNVELQISDDEKYEISKIILDIREEENEDKEDKDVITIVENIKKVKIDLSKSEKQAIEEKSKISDKKQKIIKEYLSTTYDVKESNIFIH